jgi:hypothetical protein
MGTCNHTRIVEIMLGRAISQQGLTATRKDPLKEAKAGVGGRVLAGAWASMSVEGGVMPSDVAQDATAQEGNACCGQRGSGHLAGPVTGPGL